MKYQFRRGVAAAVAGVTFTAAALVAGSMPNVLGLAPSAVVPAEAAATSVSTIDPCSTASTPEGLSTAFRCAAHRALPGVVHIQVEGHRMASAQGSPFEGLPFGFEDSPFREFFRGMPEQAPQQQQRPMPVQGSGSGFVFREGGYILTNNHVVDGADRVTVITQDKRELPAKVVGRDPNTDIAVVKVEADLPVVELGDSDPIDVGDWVVALGYPLQLGATVTSGIISATGRSIGILRGEDAPFALENYLQTDAAINPGNSGGPLVDLQGRVVGVNSAIASPTGYYSGYGFAVPVNLARRIASDLIEYGVVHRPRLGVSIRDATSADAELFGLDRVEGVVVAQVEPNAPAAQGGVELGDVILAVDGAPVVSVAELQDRIARHQPGDRVALTVRRNDARRELDVELGEFAVEPVARAAASDEAGAPAMRLGFSAEPVNAQNGRRFELSADARGAVVTQVDPTSEAARAGLQPGVLIEKLNGTTITDAESLRSAMSSVAPGKAMAVVVRQKDGSRVLLTFRAPAK